MVRRVLAALVAGGIAISNTGSGAQQPAAFDDCPAVAVHRAGMGYRPENTVVGIQWAGAIGASIVEMDVQWTKSKFPVLMHDADVSRTTNGTGHIADMWLGDATALLAQDYPPYNTDPAYSNVHVPYGWDFMAAVASSNLDVILDILAIPDQAMMDKLAYYINYFNWVPRAVIQANAATVALMRGWYPSLTYAVIEGYSALNDMTTNGQIRSGPYIAGKAAAAYTILYTGLSLPAVRYWHDSGLQVYTWTSDSPMMDVEANWDAAAAAGVDRLITNRAPDVLSWRQTSCAA